MKPPPLGSLRIGVVAEVTYHNDARQEVHIKFIPYHLTEGNSTCFVGMTVVEATLDGVRYDGSQG